MADEKTQAEKIARQTVKDILRARARTLARRVITEDTSHHYVDALYFTLAGETYALPVEFLEDVFILRDITPVPCTPPFVMGIVAIRGQIFSIINLKTLFEMPSRAGTPLRMVLLLAHNAMTFGIAVDGILGVQSLAVDMLQPPPSTLVGFRADYVQGVTGDTVIVLDGYKMLTDSRLVVQETGVDKNLIPVKPGGHT